MPSCPGREVDKMASYNVNFDNFAAFKAFYP
jgi:hypothetical protein